MSDHAVRKTIAAYFAAASMLDPASLAELFAAEGENHDPVGAHAQRGPAQVLERWNAFAAQWSDFSVEASRSYVRGPRAAVAWNASGTARNGRSLMFAGIAVFTLNGDARILRLENFYDPAPVEAELARAR